MFLRKNEPNHTFIARKGMKEAPILAIFQPLIKLMFPNHAPGPIQVYQPEIQDVLMCVPCKDESALQACIRPFVRLWIGVVDAREGGKDDFVGRYGDCSFDLGLVVGVEGRRCRHDMERERFVRLYR